jgi:hypothetical protein
MRRAPVPAYTVEDRLRATGIAHLVNLQNSTTGLVIAPNDILTIEPFQVDRIIQVILGSGFRLGNFDSDTIGLIMENPHHALLNLKVDNIGNPNGSGGMPCPDNPTGQWPQLFEKVYQDLQTGRWMIRFERELPNGKTYVQVDTLPLWVTSMSAYVPAEEGDCATYVRPRYQLFPLYPKSDEGCWVIDHDRPFEYTRRYGFSTTNEGYKMNDVGKAKFVLRSFDRNTGQYIRQYTYGHTWAMFDTHVENWDPNDRSCGEKYNRWLRQVHGRHNHEYQKRPAREAWKEYEVVVLKQHYNNRIKEVGVLSAYLSPQWEDAVRAVNKARKERDNRAAPRDLASIKAMVERDVYAADVPQLGIVEWCAYAFALVTFECENPDVRVDERFLKPKVGVSLDCGPHTRTSGKKKDEESELLAKPKIAPMLENGQLVMADVFDGKLVKVLFGVGNDPQETNIIKGGGRNVKP